LIANPTYALKIGKNIPNKIEKEKDAKRNNFFGFDYIPYYFSGFFIG
jgi:hypothetical protein